MFSIKRLFQNSFIKVSAANGIITVAKSFLIVISNKVIAIIIGTSGIAMIGQLQNLISIATLLSNGGFNQGLTKYIAERKDDKNSILEYIGTAFIVALILSSFVALLILIFSNTISYNIFSTKSYFSIIIVFAFTLFFYNMNTLILAIVNGFQLYRQYFKINITTTIVGFLLTVTLVLILKVYGALLAIVLSQSIVCLFAYLYIRNDYWISAFSFRYFSKDKLFLLLKYTAITILTAIIWPLVAMIIRTYVIKNISIEEAGLWQATRNLNDYIINIAIGSFSVYLLPRLSSISDKITLKKELITIYKIIIPISLFGFFLLFLFRDYVVILLYSKDFLKVSQYLILQMIGSFFWMCKVPVMYYMLAKGHTTIYLVNELLFAILYVILTILLIPKFQVQGIQMSFAIYNFIYFLINIYIIKKLLQHNKIL